MDTSEKPVLMMNIDCIFYKKRILSLSFDKTRRSFFFVCKQKTDPLLMSVYH